MRLFTKPRAPQNLGPHLSQCARRRQTEQAEARIFLVVLAAFLLGAAAGAFWVYHQHGASPAATQDPSLSQLTGLSEGSKTVLSQLVSPVEIRFYSVLDPANTPEPVRSFSGRVEAVLRAFQREANGKITVTRSNSQSYTNQNAALGDGIKPFDEARGEPSFLGIAVINHDRKASLAQLSPEWEPALEYDIARTILSTMNTPAAVNASPMSSPKVNSNLVEEIKRSLPNLASLSLAEATRMLRQASVKEFATAANQFQIQLAQAQERLKTAQIGGTEAEQQAALNDLQQVQAEQAARLKEIAAESQAQIEGLKQLKSGSP